MYTRFLLAVLLVMVCDSRARRQPRRRSQRRLERSTEVFSEIMKTPDKGIPEDLLGQMRVHWYCAGFEEGRPGPRREIRKGSDYVPQDRPQLERAVVHHH